MISYNTIITQVLVLFILISAGFYARKRKFINDEINKGVTNIILNIGLPALLLNSFILDFDKSMLKNAGLVVLLSLLIHVVLFIVGKIVFAKYEIDKKNIMNYALLFPNAGFMGLPFVYAIYGQVGVFYAAIFIIPYHILMWTYGLATFMKVKDYRSSVKTILINPVLLGVLAGLFIFITQIPIPPVLSKSLGMLGSVTSPLAMMLIGDRMATTKFTKVINDKNVYFASFMRLILAPILTWLILKAFTLDPMIINICVAVETLPTAITIAVLPAQYNGDAALGSKCAVISHVLSLVTIPLMMIILMVK